jgi:hypothetical protein
VPLNANRQGNGGWFLPDFWNISNHHSEAVVYMGKVGVEGSRSDDLFATTREIQPRLYRAERSYQTFNSLTVPAEGEMSDTAAFQKELPILGHLGNQGVLRGEKRGAGRFP